MYGQTHSRTRSKDRQRGRGSRQRPEGMRLSQQLRTPIVVFLVCLVTFFYNLDHISAPIRHPRASAPIPPSKVLMTRLRRLSNPRPSSPRLAFAPSSNPIPVHHDLVEIDFDNHPVADSRPPSHQFTLDRSIRKMPPPVIAIITCTHDPRDVFEDTAKALFGQSLQNFIWVIVDDHTSSQASLTLLKTVSKDPRVTILHNKPGVTGLPAGRNVALSHILALKNIPPYLASLDDDDLFELTALEKVTWMLESNPQWAIGGFRYIKFGAANESVTTGLHSGFTNWQEVSLGSRQESSLELICPTRRGILYPTLRSIARVPSCRLDVATTRWTSRTEEKTGIFGCALRIMVSGEERFPSHSSGESHVAHIR
jgi:hypothetical protein